MIAVCVRFVFVFVFNYILQFSLMVEIKSLTNHFVLHKRTCGTIYMRPVGTRLRFMSVKTDLVAELNHYLSFRK